jgi:hypothetical protein
MSTTYYAVAIVGCKVEKSRVQLEKRSRNYCEHNPSNDECLEYCPRCGKHLWHIKKVWIPQFDEDEETICGFRVFYNEYEDYVIIAGDFVATDCDGYAMNGSMLTVDTNVTGIIAPFAESRQKLRAAIEPIGLWDDGKQFGIWPFLDRS